MNAICLVLDRLHAGYVGAYGNAWIETPSLDRMAAEGFVADQFLIDSPPLESLYRAYWQGRHALEPDANDSPNLIGLLREKRVKTSLLTDDPMVALHPAAEAFDSRLKIDRPHPTVLAKQIEQTHLASCFCQLIDRLESAGDPFCVWCHLAGLGGPWDAPWSLRTQYSEPEDPDPSRSPIAVAQRLPTDFDPDVLFGHCQAYAGQVTLLDTCLGALLEFLDTDRVGQETLLMLISARGFPLGEHGRVGPTDEALHSELVHVPLIVRFPDREEAASRTQALLQPADVFATLLDWWGVDSRPVSLTAASLLPIVRGEIESNRDRLCLIGQNDQRAIRTPAWYLRKSAESQLYVKPDDRWEVNEVSVRCPTIVERLEAVMTEYHDAVRSGQIDALSPLEDHLLEGLE